MLTWLNGQAPLLADLALRSAAVLVVVAGLTVLLRRRSAAVRHVVWSGGFAAAVVIPVAGLVGPGWRVLPEWKGGRSSAVIQPAVNPGSRSPQLAGAGSFPTPTITQPPSTPTDVRIGGAPAMSGRAVYRGASAVLAWAAGCGLLLLRLAWSGLYLERLRRSAIAADGSWKRLLEQAGDACGLRRSIELKISRHVRMPLTFGLISPCIVLPESCIRWTEERRRMVLLHEMAHVARGDAWMQLLAGMAGALHWFNPLIWIAGRQLEIEREQACDDLVLAMVKDGAPAYAETLLEIAASSDGRVPMGIAGLAMARKSCLESRVRRVLDGRSHRDGARLVRGRVAAVFIAGIALLSGGLGIMRTSTGQATSPAKPDSIAPSPADATRGDPFVHPLEGGRSLELVAVTNPGGSPWWTPTGAPAVPDCYVAFQEAMRSPGEKVRGAMVLLHGPALPEGALLTPSPTEGAAQAAVLKADRQSVLENAACAIGSFPMDAQKGTFRLGLATAPWKTIAEGGESASGQCAAGEFSIGKFLPVYQGGDANFGLAAPGGELFGGVPRAVEAGGNPTPNCTSLKVAHTFDTQGLFRVVAVTADGKELTPSSQSAMGQANGLKEEMLVFPSMQVKSVRFQVRAIQWIEFKDVALEPRGRAPAGARDEPPQREVTPEAGATGANGGEKGGVYYVMGDVERPGVYSVAGRKITILQAMAASAMKNDHADAMLITLVRRDAQEKETKTDYSFKALLADRSSDIALQQDDVLIVRTNTAGMETVEKSARRTELEARRKQIQSQLDELLKTVGPGNAYVKAVRNQLAGVEDQLKALEPATQP